MAQASPVTYTGPTPDTIDLRDRAGSQWTAMKARPAARSEVLNPIRQLLENDLKPTPNHELPMINLGLGEPNRANGFELPEVINESIKEVVDTQTNNGYTQACGTVQARTAVAEKFSTEDYPIHPDSVFLAFGCSGALFNAISVLCEQGDNILAPSPGFPLCQPICSNLNVEMDTYKLVADKRWEIDLDDLRSKINSKTKAILVNNPSNPCGSCFTREHMEEILAVAEEFKIPIISDEVYYGLSYDPERPFISFGNVSKTVPIITTGAISKIYCLPGWRCGWTIVYNNSGFFDHVLSNMNKLSMIQLHPCSLVQAALPKILKEVPDEHMENMKQKLALTSHTAFARLSEVQGVTPIKSSAAMYMMVQIDMDKFPEIKDDTDFCIKLLKEQNCLTFPSSCFFQTGLFRIILCTKPETVTAFAERLQTFVAKHIRQ